MSIYAGLVRTVAPATEILPLDTVEAYLKVDSDSGGAIDQDIVAFTSFAREQVETILRRTLLLSTWKLSLQHWPGCGPQNQQSSDLDRRSRFDYIELPMGAPLQSVTSVIYRDTNANSLTMPQGNIAGGYNVDANYEPGRIVLPYSQIWPTEILLPGAAIQILYLCGYSDVATLEASFEGFSSVVMAMKMIISYVFENRIPPSEMRKSFAASGIQYVIEELLTPYRIFA